MSQDDFSPYMECSIALAVDLANTWDPRTGSNDGLPDLDALRGFLEAHKVTGTKPPTRAELAEIHRISADLRAVFEAPAEAAAAELLNRMLDHSGARPSLTDHGDGPWHLHYSPTGSPVAARLEAESAMALAWVVAGGGFERLRVCDGGDCWDVFVDESRNRSRRYCSPAVCGNRAAVAAFRARRRAASE